MTSRPLFNRRFPPRRLFIPLLAASAIGFTSIAAAQHEGHDTESGEQSQQAGHLAHDLLLFPSARYEQRNGLDSSALDDSELTPSIDIFYSRSA